MAYETVGTSALKGEQAPRALGLRVIEGGLGAGVARPAAARLGAGQLRLLAAAALALLAVLALAAFAGEARQEARREAAQAQVAFERVVVGEGDTLWGLALEHPVAGLSTRETVDLIAEANEGLDACLEVGEYLWVPAS